MISVETSLKECMGITGAVACALVDYTSGMTLGSLGGDRDFDIEVAAAGNTDVVRAKLRTMSDLGIQEDIEDVLITMDRQYHIIRPVRSSRGAGLFLYLVLNRDQANLAMARRLLQNIEVDLDV